MPSGTQRLGLLALLLAPSLPAAVSAPLELNSRFLRAVISPQGATLESVAPAGHTENLLLSAKAAHPSQAHGHFLCFDRWGPVTAVERERGRVFHGEARQLTWQVVEANAHLATLRTTLPVSRLGMARTFKCEAEVPVLTITSHTVNDTDQLRPYNLVEHALLDAVWLQTTVRLHTNARKGHLHYAGRPVPDSEFTWPLASLHGTKLDLRHQISSLRYNLLASLVFPLDEPWAWVLLTDAGTGSAFALVWRRAEFPWLNLWWRGADGVTPARAIEPGTTGLHGTMEECVERGQLLNNPLHGVLLPGETRAHHLHYVLLPNLTENAKFLGAEVTEGALRTRWQTKLGPTEHTVPLPSNS